VGGDWIAIRLRAPSVAAFGYAGMNSRDNGRASWVSSERLAVIYLPAGGVSELRLIFFFDAEEHAEA
jgi:hypothetical protein